MLRLALLLTMAGCRGRSSGDPCRVPSPVTPPELSYQLSDDGEYLVMPAEDAVAWASWSDAMIRWSVMVGHCPGVQDTGKPMPEKWSPRE